MLKNILNLEGAQQLSKNEQSSINGGKTSYWCEDPKNNFKQCGGTSDYICMNGVCTYCPGC